MRVRHCPAVSYADSTPTRVCGQAPAPSDSLFPFPKANTPPKPDESEQYVPALQASECSGGSRRLPGTLPLFADDTAMSTRLLRAQGSTQAGLQCGEKDVSSQRSAGRGHPPYLSRGLFRLAPQVAAVLALA